ncbi:MAG: SHOCT domain-containing protein [Flavobacteriales bacterium]|nr:SHOCT domain-containing protein [Flavobacteriales bacterium]
MKTIILVMTLMLSLTSLGQKLKTVDNFDMSTPFDEVKNSYKMSFFIENSLTLADGSAIIIGDELKLGTSASKLSNSYETIFIGTINGLTTAAVAGAPPTRASTAFKGNTYILSKIKCMRFQGQLSFQLELTNSKSTAALKSMKTIVASSLSLENGELVNPNAPMSSDEALAELKRAKDKLDLGLITQAEFDEIKSKLAPLIK